MARLDEQARNELLGLAPGHMRPAGTTLISQGGNDSSVYLLEPARSGTSACVKVLASLANGTETLLGIGVSGDVVGELASLWNRTRSATVVTCSAVIAHAIPGNEFMAFLSRHPSASRALTLMIADRLDWSNRRRQDFAGHDVRVHLARVIVELVRRHGYQTAEGWVLGVSLSQPELGRLIGAGQDATSLAVRELRNDGLVLTRYRGLVVLDMDGLMRAGQLEE